MFSDILFHMNNNYHRYDLIYNFRIQNFQEETLNFLNVRIINVDGDLPPLSELKSKTIYTFVKNGNLQAIYNYDYGFIFNPNHIDISETNYQNINDEKFDVNMSDQEKFMDFLGSIRSNQSMFQNIDDDNSVSWCLLIAYLDSRSYTINDFLHFINKNGEFKSLAFNKLYYLSIFISYCCIVGNFSGDIPRRSISNE